MLMSTDEALVYVHGEMETIRDGEVTHQAVQTNLADVICGGKYHEPVGSSKLSSNPILMLIHYISYINILTWKGEMIRNVKKNGRV